MDEPTVHAGDAKRNQEDYTGSLSLLLVGGGSTLIDIEDFARLSPWPWMLNNGRVMYYEQWKKASKYGSRGIINNISRWIMNPPYNRVVDHINRCPTDNRRKNLRICTRSQNAANSLPRGGSSEYKGVTKLKGRERWVAACGFKGKIHHLGTFTNEVAAAIAYNQFALKKYGEFAYLNPIPPGSRKEAVFLEKSRAKKGRSKKG